MRLFGGILPFIGWRTVDQGVIELMSESIEELDTKRNYSAFHIEWLSFGFITDFKDKGPKDNVKQF